MGIMTCLSCADELNYSYSELDDKGLFSPEWADFP